MAVRECSFASCRRGVYGQELCPRHYQQLYRDGAPHITIYDLNTEQRLLAKRDITKSGCWEWTGSTNPAGYGWARLDGKPEAVHKASYRTWIGELAPGSVVHHKCANRKCFNPEHLQLTSQTENVAEMLARRDYEARIAFLENRVRELEKELAG